MAMKALQLAKSCKEGTVHLGYNDVSFPQNQIAVGKF